MDRQIVYPGQVLPETTLLQITKDVMIALAKLSGAVFGTSTVANGFAVSPTAPATLQVSVAAGEIYSLQNVDGTAFSSLAADTAHQIVKQGIALDATLLTLAAPGTTGQSINYLIEASYQDTDSAPVLLPYYNTTTPSYPYSGLGNNGLTQNTSRKGAVVLQAKAGVSATTGTQSTPSPDSGYVGLCVVTVAYGQTQILAANIAAYSAAPLLTTGLLQSIQSGNLSFGTDIGTAGVIQATYPIPVTALVDNMECWVKTKYANPGATTFTPNPGVIPAYPVVGGAHVALQGGEIVPNGRCGFIWRADITSWVLIEQTGGAVQVPSATQSQHAMPLGQFQAAPLSFRNLLVNGAMRVAQQYGTSSVTPAASTNTWTIDQWHCWFTQASKLSAQQVSGPTALGFDFYEQITVAAAYSALAADAFVLAQSIEAQSLAAAMWGTANAQPVSLQFVVNSSVAGTFSGSLQNYAGTRSYPFTFTIPTANTDTKITIPNIPGDTGGAWTLTGSSGGLTLCFDLGSGASFRGPAGAWASANYYGATAGTAGATLLATAGATFKITGGQLELGPVCTAFERPTPDAELARCQRYLYAIQNASGGYAHIGTGFLPSATSFVFTINHRVSMRVPPAGVVISGIADLKYTTGTAGGTPSSVVFNIASKDASRLAATIASGAASGAGGDIYFDSSSTGSIILTGAQL